MRPSTPPRRSKRFAAGLSILLALPHYSSAATADDLAQTIPSCALACVEKNADDQGCALSDYKCQCESDVTDLPVCILGACSVDDYIESSSVMSQICIQVLIGDPGSGDLDLFPSISIPGFTGLPSSTPLSGSPSGDKSDSDSLGGSGSGADADTGGTGGSGGSGGMSRGEIAGLAIGVTLGVLLIVAGAFALIWRRRKAKKPAPTGGTSPGYPQFSGQGAANTVSDQKSIGTTVSQMTPGGFGSMSPSAGSMGTFATYPTQATPSPGPGMVAPGPTAELQSRNTAAVYGVPGSIPEMGMYTAQPAVLNQRAGNIHEIGTYMAQPAELGQTAATISEMGTYCPQPAELSSTPASVPAHGGNQGSIQADQGRHT